MPNPALPYLSNKSSIDLAVLSKSAFSTDGAFLAFGFLTMESIVFCADSSPEKSNLNDSERDFISERELLNASLSAFATLSSVFKSSTLFATASYASSSLTLRNAWSLKEINSLTESLIA